MANGRARNGGGGAGPEARFASAVRLFEAGDIEGAAKIADALARTLPGDPGVLQLVAAIRLGAGDPKGAVRALRKGLKAAPRSAALNDLLGTALLETGDAKGAERAHRKALATAPGDAGVLNNLGTALSRLDRPEDARDAYRESLRHRPDHPTTLANLGTLLIDLGDDAGAEAALRQAAALAPDFADVHINLAFVQIRRRALDDAIGSCRRALELDPRNVAALNNWGRAAMALGRNDEAEAAVARALEVDPRHTESLQSMGLLRFLRGQWREAWDCYELRWRIEATRFRRFPQPLWQGEPVAGKTVLVWGEQGVGDEIMFTSMVPDLVEAGARVVLELDDRLLPLYRRSFPDVACVPRETPPRPETLADGIDVQVPSGSLGKWLRADDGAFPRRRSFLAADRALSGTLRRRYGGDGAETLIGISWRSVNLDIGDDKSMDLTAMRPIAELPGVRLVDLQYGDTAAERAAFEAETGIAVAHDPDVDPMVDLDAFAAQVAAMDRVVSISNTTVHMAGALGVPASVMLPVVPLWRWMMDRDDTPWYPSLRLFRQRDGGDWPDVVARVRDALAAAEAGPG